MSAQATHKPAVAYMALCISFVAACLFGAGFRTCRCLDERGWGCGFNSFLNHVAAVGDIERIQDLLIRERINRSLDAFWIETCS